MGQNLKGIQLKEGSLKEFFLHAIWLRERVTGEKNLDKNNFQRLYEPSLLDSNIFITDYKVDHQSLYVKFSDNIESHYKIEDLKKEIFERDIIPKKILWSDIDLEVLTFDQNILNNNEKILVEMLKSFYAYGFIIVKNVKGKKDEIIKFAEKLGPIRETNYGKIFDVISKKNPNNLAYTSLGLSVHADNPYRKPVPGIQILHCLVNDAKGGDSTLVDGYSVSEHLKENYKDSFDVLTSTEIKFKFIDNHVILENIGKLIELDIKGDFKQIRLNGRCDYVPLKDKKTLNNYYSSRKIFFDLCNSENFKIKFKLQKGMLIMFDNHRLLHGRSKFYPNTGHRHLQGCYIEHDVTEGKLRRLLSK
tara:strand:- start:2545 stop:3627 length:1083 start_codon:yes stop_codon:yes gene_type:complete